MRVYIAVLANVIEFCRTGSLSGVYAKPETWQLKSSTGYFERYHLATVFFLQTHSFIDAFQAIGIIIYGMSAI